MFEVIITKGELYDKCENIEQLYDGFYYPLLVEYKELKEKLDKYENPDDMTLMYMWCDEKLKDENKELKKQLEEYKDNYNCLLKQKEQFEYIMSKQVDYQGQQKEFINYLEDEKDRLIKETSHYYIDSFDRQHAVNEDIFDEVNDILQKYKSTIGDDK